MIYCSKLTSSQPSIFSRFLSSQWPTFASHKILDFNNQAWGLVTYNPPHSSLFSFFYLSHSMLLLSPETPGNGHRSTPCAWRSIRGQSSRLGHFHRGKKGCRGCCHVAYVEPGRAGHAADTGHCSTPPSPLHCALLGKRCCGGWQWCSAPCGWCGEGSNAPPKKSMENISKRFWGKLVRILAKCDIYNLKIFHHCHEINRIICTYMICILGIMHDELQVFYENGYVAFKIITKQIMFFNCAIINKSCLLGLLML